MKSMRISDAEVRRLRAAGVAVPESAAELKKLLDEAEASGTLPLEEAIKEIRRKIRARSKHAHNA